MPRGIPPQSLQVVVGPCLGGENVDDQIGVVHQDPFGLLVALNMGGSLADFFHSHFDFVANGTDLGGRSARTQKECICK